MAGLWNFRYQFGGKFKFWRGKFENIVAGRIPDILGRIMRTGGEELVKFLQDVLDALFAMFSTEDGNSTPHSGLVFHVLGNIAGHFHVLQTLTAQNKTLTRKSENIWAK